MQSWTERIGERLRHVEKEVPWWVNDKVRLYNFCRAENLPMPEMYRKWRKPDMLQLEGLPDAFVLKPSVMHSSWGVMVLSRTGKQGEYFEALSGRTLTSESIRREQERVFEKCKYKGSYHLFAEERIAGESTDRPIPLDYKIFTFFDRATLIQQIDRNSKPNRMAWFDGEFRKLALEGRVVSDWSKVQLGAHSVPDAAKEMVEIATRAAVALNTPFMRVDMFSRNGVPVIGEMTPAPGGPYYKDWYSFTEAFDAELGQDWHEAERALSP